MSELDLPRYSFAGDEYIFVEMGLDMDLEVNFKIQATCKRILEEGIPGVIEVYPGNITYLVHYSPEEITPEKLLEKIKKIDKKSSEFFGFSSRLIEIPVLYNDPWTIECSKEFASGHQDQSITNLEYVAKINGVTVSKFIEIHSSTQYLVTMERFLPGSCCLIQMADKSQALSCPKYLVPRKWSPVRSLVMGGIITSISPYRSPGGYQLLGRSAVPVYDPEKKLLDMKDGILVRSGDRVKLRSIDMDEYESIQVSVEAGEYRFRIVEQEFEPVRYLEDPEGYLKLLQGVLGSV